MTNESVVVKNEAFLGDTREFCERQKLEEIKKKNILTRFMMLRSRPF